MRVQVKVAWAPTDDEALAGAYDQWRTNVFDSTLMADLETGRAVRGWRPRTSGPTTCAASVLVSADPAGTPPGCTRCSTCGVDELVRPPGAPASRTAFIEAFGDEVLPELGWSDG